MGLQATTIATSIAALTVSGVTIKSLSDIPEEVMPRQCPIIYPKPNGFMSGLMVEIDSFGSTSAKKTVRYTLSYIYLYAQAGEGRGLFSVYSSMVTKALLFLDAIIANDALSGTVDIQPSGIMQFGPVSDPSGKLFHGCQIDLAIQEFVN